MSVNSPILRRGLSLLAIAVLLAWLIASIRDGVSQFLDALQQVGASI